MISVMPTRRFVDSNGVSWRVWSTVPGGVRVLTPDYAQGWLTFESERELRRLAPMPDDWDSRPDAELQRLCERATEVPRHTGPIARMTRPEAGAQPQQEGKRAH